MLSSECRHVNVLEGYELWSEIYDQELNPLVLLEEPVVRKWIASPAGLHIADVGCGTGRHTRWLASLGARVDAFDASRNMLDKARAKFDKDRVQFVLHQLPHALPVRNNTYDLALLSLVADHLGDLAASYQELHRVIRPGGSLIFTVLHPAMNLRGLTARFSDPRDGVEVRVQAYQHSFGNYIMGALDAGFAIEELTESIVSEELVSQTPRAEKYLGWPLLLAMRLKKTRC